MLPNFQQKEILFRVIYSIRQ